MKNRKQYCIYLFILIFQSRPGAEEATAGRLSIKIMKKMTQMLNQLILIKKAEELKLTIRPSGE